MRHDIIEYAEISSVIGRTVTVTVDRPLGSYHPEHKDMYYPSLDVVCHFPLNMLIKNPELLNEQECQYAMNPATHLDFLIYNRIGKKPVLAIEVDGYEYHKEDTVQASRDLLKNHIMELYEVPLLRFMTNGSGEKEKIIEMLDKLVG